MERRSFLKGLTTSIFTFSAIKPYFGKIRERIYHPDYAVIDSPEKIYDLSLEAGKIKKEDDPFIFEFNYATYVPCDVKIKDMKLGKKEYLLEVNSIEMNIKNNQVYPDSKDVHQDILPLVNLKGQPILNIPKGYALHVEKGNAICFKQTNSFNRESQLILENPAKEIIEQYEKQFGGMA